MTRLRRALVRPLLAAPLSLMILLFVRADATTGQVAPVTLDPLPPVGCMECEGPELFGLIRALDVTPDGGFVVADRDPPIVRFFAADGTPGAAFGRHGEGPGEFRRAAGVAALPDGGLVVSDMMTPRLTILGPDGDVRSTVRVDGAIMRLQSAPGGVPIAAQEAQWATMSAGIHLVDERGAVVATPLPTSVDRVLDREGRPASPGLVSMAVDASGRVAVGMGHTYSIRILDASGQVVDSIVRDVARTERTPEEVEALRAAYSRGRAAAAAEAAAGGGGVGRQSIQIDPLRPHFPTDALAWDDAGRLWVRTFRGGPGRTVFDLFSPDGAFLGEIGLDVELGLWSIGHGLLVGVTEDPDFGVHSVARWRVSG